LISFSFEEGIRHKKPIMALGFVAEMMLTIKILFLQNLSIELAYNFSSDERIDNEDDLKKRHHFHAPVSENYILPALYYICRHVETNQNYEDLATNELVEMEKGDAPQVNNIERDDSNSDMSQDINE
jgi:hypothetical protein